MFDCLTLDQPTGLFYVMLFTCSLSNCISCIFYALNCVACHTYHAFLKTLYECMFIVNCLMFRLYGEKRRLFAAEAPTSPFCQGKWHMNYLLFFTMHVSGFISIYACQDQQLCYANFRIAHPYQWSSTYINLVVRKNATQKLCDFKMWILLLS